MAETPGQAETQPALAIPETMNPHEAVKVFASLMKETPRNEKGQFTEETPPKEPEVEKPDEVAQEPEAPEVKEAPRKLKLKYRGEEREVDETEAVELAQKGYDYTQKSQALAKEREEMGQKLKSESEQARQAYAKQLEVQRQAVLKLADQEALTGDLAQIALTDPVKALQLQLKRQQIEQTYQSIVGEQQRLEQQRVSEFQQDQQKRISEAREKVLETIPGWNDALYGKILKSGVDNYGFSQAEVNTLTDPRAMQVLHDAMQWREYQSAKPKAVDKRVASVPKVQKPGTGESPAKSKDTVKDGLERLEKTGSRQDAQAVVAEMLRAGRI